MVTFDESKVAEMIDVVSIQNDGELKIEYKEQEFSKLWGVNAIFAGTCLV